MKRFMLLAGFPLVAAAQPAEHGTFFTAPYGPGGTWNLYQTNSIPATWTKAQAAAEATPDPLGKTGKPGHLVTIGSAAENMFVYQQVRGHFIWIGLTDNEKWGGTEALSDRKGGWRWVTGEPLTFVSWRSSEPNEIEAGGEDGIAMEHAGRWNDWGMGSDGQSMPTHPSMTEWDTQAKEPVPGAIAIKPVLPPTWPVDLTAWKGTTKGTGPWTVYGDVNIRAASIETVVAGLVPKLAETDVVYRLYRLPRLNYRWPAGPPLACGWVDMADLPIHPNSQADCAALHVAKVRLEKAGTWSFNIHGDDYFAVRFPGHKWKSVTGLGGIDPLDQSVIYFANDSPDGCAIGVIDLPAGEHVIEVLLANRVLSTVIQLMATPGEITVEGATDKWRFPGHKAAGDLAWPGTDPAGWTVTRTDREPTGPKLTNLMTGFALANSGAGKPVEGVDKINYIDSGGAGDIEFPDPVPFPGDKPGSEDGYVIKANANLVIPRDGIYHIGFHADACAAMRIIGQSWKRLVRDTSLTAKLEGDTFYTEFPNGVATNAQVVGEVELKKGSYPMEVFYTEFEGPSVLSVFASPAGYAPRLLAKDGAKIEPDIDGLPLVE